MLGQSQVALKLQSRVLADRMMRCQECAETDTRHQDSSLCSQRCATDGNQIPKKSKRYRVWAIQDRPPFSIPVGRATKRT
jgi:hypothetical protein